MITVINRADSNRKADLGHLDEKKRNHKVYLNPEQLNFGALKVLKDVVLEGGKGFRTHEHKNLEIVIIPIHGQLEHKDSLGNVNLIKANDIQIISAGTGIFHYEFNQNKDIPVRFLQIWLEPKINDINPCYRKISFRKLIRTNEIVKILSSQDDKSNHKASFYILRMNEDFSNDFYLQKKDFGLYLHVIDGEVSAGEITLSSGDGCGFSELEILKIYSKSKAKLLLIEVPIK